MKSARDLQPLLDFLKALRENNNRAWFEAHRADWEEVRSLHEAVVGEIIVHLDEVDDLAGISPGECVFRIHRDVRFSADKSPYKTALGALMGPGGRKSGVRSYYLHIEPEGGSFLAGGLHSPTADELRALRLAIDEDARPLRKLLSAPAFIREFGGLSGDELKTAPSGYAKDHPAIDLLRRKQFLASRPLEDAFVARGDLVGEAVRAFKAMKPFLLYLESTLP